MKTDKDFKTLYEITGNILDINTLLVPRLELRNLLDKKKDSLYTQNEVKVHHEPRHMD